MAQFVNFVTVEFLDVHQPSEKEKHNPMLYANDVRLEICTKLGVVSTAHSLSDYILMQHAQAKNAKFDTLRFVMEDVTERLLFRTRTVTRLCDVYCRLDVDEDGFMDYDEFCAAFKRDPHDYRMIHLFRLFNTKSIGCEKDLKEYEDYEHCKDKWIEFEDFLVGVSVCYVDSMIEDAVRILFDVVRESPHQIISKEDVMQSYPNEEQISSFCECIFANDPEEVTFDTFYERVLTNKQQHTVHHFLQTIITSPLGIQLAESD
eukprot:238039_1